MTLKMVGLVGGLLLLFAPIAFGQEAIWWESGMVKLRAENSGPEGDPVPKNADLCQEAKCLKGGIRIAAAQNEFEPFQIFIAASPDADLKKVDVILSDLVDEKGAHPISSRLPGDLMVYRQYYIQINKPTTPEAKKGAWPDALIPKVDEYFGERRSYPGEGRPAFPFDVPRGRKQGIWIDVFVRPDTPPGIYIGSATVTVGEKKAAMIPIQLTVRPFRLPSTSSLRNAYAVGITELGRGHDWDDPRANERGFINDDRTSELICLYTKALLVHRLSNESVIWPPPRWDKSKGKIRWIFPEAQTSCQEKYPEFLNGVNSLPGGKLKGARLTSIRLRDGYGFNNVERYDPTKLISEYYSDYVSYFKQNEWLDRLFDYTRDEPKFTFQRSTKRRECWPVEESPERPDTDWDKIRRRAIFLHQHAPGLKVLVTTDRQAAESCFERIFNDKEVKKYIDIWVVSIKRMHGKPDSDTFNKNFRPVYDDAFIGPGKQLWWYHACGSHGCGDGSEKGWPTVMVDFPAVHTRIFEWLTYAYQTSGELYYETIFQYPFSYKMVKGAGGKESKVADRHPFDDVYYFGGNGDGILFYPGRPDLVGGKKHIPIESIRLKLTREGYEDYEYLKLAEAKKGREWIEKEILPLLRESDKTPLTVYQWTRQPEKLSEAREKLAAALQ
jgi:hypothetical protein